MPAAAVSTPAQSPDGNPRTVPAGPADGPSVELLPQTGDRIGRYKLGRKLGEGGMGAVFQAIDLDLRRPVALKLMLPELAADPANRTRFLREARAAAAVSHDHVVTIYQVGEHRKVPYLAMQYLKGCSLARYLTAKPAVPVRQAVRIGREIALGLAAAHAKGLIHRDVKPGNIWLEAPAGRVKLLDFGLAKRPTGAAGELTVPGMILGTPGYMAPEQARGLPVDARTDLFALGAVLYELLALRAPFARGTPMETLTAAAHDDPTPLRSANPEVPAELAELVHRLLAKTPAGRPGSAAEVADGLKRFERVGQTTDNVRLPASMADDPGFEVLDTAMLGALTVDPPPSEEVDHAYVEALTARRRRKARTRYGLLVGAVALAGAAVLALRGCGR